MGKNKITLDEFVSVLIKGLKSFVEYIFSSIVGVFFWKVMKLCTMLMIIIIGGLFAYIFGGQVLHLWEIEPARVHHDKLGYGYTYNYESNDYYRKRAFISDENGRKIIKNVTWVKYEKGDSIVAFSKNQFRGYLNVRSGKQIVKPEKYTEVYLYKEGRAMAMTGDSIYILDDEGREIGKAFLWSKDRNTDINCFHNGGLPMVGENGKMGVVGRNAEWLIEPQFDYITFGIDHYWIAKKDAVPAIGDDLGEPARAAVFDESTKLIVEGEWSRIWVSRDAGIIVTGKDNWQSCYDFDGNLVNDFVFDGVENLTYETGEAEWRRIKTDSYYSVDEEYEDKEIPITKIATLMKYVTSEGWVGLISSEGKPITPPLYWDIKAIGKNVYKASLEKSSSYSVLLNEKGKIIGRDS